MNLIFFAFDNQENGIVDNQKSSNKSKEIFLFIPNTGRLQNNQKRSNKFKIIYLFTPNTETLQNLEHRKMINKHILS